ncbi:23S rRNA (uracil-5-)-methyltransferase RumA [Syntrophotalea acetylenivorans]|uniref:23S rRNA (Uracil-5-)-methyltransferase RumA n=1 Tax=Syntrophotalea acetylenivorans TaxID=1842532 RepID=A0A1L3GRQ1_9BACT|nr:23S rRNA (uracil(1939)-C(5))-methyltransferase RlmD [Syntrophotalea acetylenivorans]APG28622.1 23S rRNA (uracil-5-)-methyltransferase RumA [Syntrophotalea acetylenivorans]
MAKRPTNNNRPRRRQSLPTTQATISQLNDEGVGIAYHEGKELLVAGALAGEKVLVAIEHSGQRRSIGQLRRVLEKSPLRRTSPCNLAERCQSCALIQMDYEAQLRYKSAKLKQALADFEMLKDLQPQPILAAEHPLGYRTNAKLALSKERGKVHIGLYRRGTHKVVDIEDCPLHHPLINRIVRTVKDEIQRQKIFIYDPQTRRGLLRYLLIKVSPKNEKAMVTFVTAERNYREITHLAKWLARKVPEVISVHQNINGSTGNVVMGRETIRMLGVPDLIDQVGDIRLRISPTSFFQVNHEQAARIYELVRKWAALENHETALDLYCGIGGIALHLAKDAGSVTGIEVVEEAVLNACENARMNRLGNCHFLAGDSAELIHDLAPDSVKVAVINPPRSGCQAEVLEALAELAPARIIYVSCNPATLARDLDLLHEKSYRVTELQPVDMFPQTAHLETVVHLQHRN